MCWICDYLRQFIIRIDIFFDYIDFQKPKASHLVLYLFRLYLGSMVYFEVLVSTMFRSDLSFLESMFVNNNIDDYAILVINQTNRGEELKSKQSNVRVVNSYDRGTSSSRNLAITHTKADYALFADDDTVFVTNFEQIILREFEKYTDAYLITFECTTGDLYHKHTRYPSPGKHTKKSLKPIHMVVMAIRVEVLKAANVYFNPYFSLGGLFSGGTEYVFLRAAYDKKLIAYHVDQNIVHHHELSSGKMMAANRNLHTRAARVNHFYGVLCAYIWLGKYILFLWRNDYISSCQIAEKYQAGKKGIQDYQNLLRQGAIKRPSLL